MNIGIIVSMKKGLEHFVYRELREFSAQGHVLHLFATKHHAGLYNPEPIWNLKTWNLPSVLFSQLYGLVAYPLKYFRLLREAITTQSLPDFLLAWDFSRSMGAVDMLYATFGDHKLFIGYYCKHILQIPLVVTIHAYELYLNPNPVLFERALRACDRIITVTEFNRNLIINRYPVKESSVYVVRISVDTEDYTPEDKFVILIVAFFAERKGHEVLFKAVKMLHNPDLEVWVVGDKGAEQSSVDVRRLAANLGVQDQVVFWGILNGCALKALYRACDVFCLPCHVDSAGVAEGFPTAIAEAMAFAKPVITTFHVEIPYVLDELLVKENDVCALASAIDKLYRSPDLGLKLGTSNRLRAERLFSLKNPRETLRIFQAAVARNADASASPSHMRSVPNRGN
jgi:glycosyltransferase involved in cell wall biosynthesis